MIILLEVLRELDLVEEHPGIVILVIESILELPDALHRPVNLLVPTKHQKDRIRLSELRVEGLHICCLCDSVLFVAALAAEQVGNRGLPNVSFVGEAEDRMQADLWEGM